jgi:flagellar assembly protein FliH
MGQVIRQAVVNSETVAIPGSNSKPGAASAATSSSAALKEPTHHFHSVAAEVVAKTSSPTLMDSQDLLQKQAAERDIATKQGYQDGLSQGRKAADAEIKAKLEQLSSLIDACSNEISARLDRLDDEFIDLAFSAITRILGNSLSSRAGVEAVIRQVIHQRREEATPVTVRLSARDWELLGEQGRSALTTGSVSHWVVDPKIELGGCIVDGGRGSLDGRLETQLAKMKQALLDCHAGQREP